MKPQTDSLADRIIDTLIVSFLLLSALAPVVYYFGRALVQP